MSRFNWESLFGALLASSMFGIAYGHAAPESFQWWVPLLFGMGASMMRSQ